MTTARPRPTARLMRQADAARHLGINRASIHHHIATGALAVETVYGVRFVTRATVLTLAAKRRRRGVA